MNLDFTGQLLPSLRSGQVCFWHNFESPGCILMLLALNWLDSFHFVALGKTSFAKESASLIPHNLAGFISILGIKRLHFFFNNLQSTWNKIKLDSRTNHQRRVLRKTEKFWIGVLTSGQWQLSVRLGLACCCCWSCLAGVLADSTGLEIGLAPCFFSS